MIRYICVMVGSALILTQMAAMEKTAPEDDTKEQKFAELCGLKWREEFLDCCTENWRKQWFLDGERASVRNTPQGMVFSAGPIEKDDASHAVLWTKKSLSGDVKIEFDYTRMDTITKYVNILYIQATGTGKGPYDKDIAKWAELRSVPYMRSYYENMNLLHISFAAYSRDGDEDYVRVRRYPVTENLKFKEITVQPDYFDTALFEPGIVYHFTVIKKGHDLYMKVENASVSRLFYWDTSRFPPITAGRIGLRHMWTRCSRYKNFRISTMDSSGED